MCCVKLTLEIFEVLSLVFILKLDLFSKIKTIELND